MFLFNGTIPATTQNLKITLDYFAYVLGYSLSILGLLLNNQPLDHPKKSLNMIILKFSVFSDVTILLFGTHVFLR